MSNVRDEINNAISNFRKTEVVEVGGELVRMKPKEVTAVYVNSECWYGLCQEQGPTALSGHLADGYKFHNYDIFPVGYDHHPRVRVV